jgi:acetyltransferase
MNGGLQVQIRPICPEDEPLMVCFHKTLSDRTVYLRYFCSLSFAARTDHARLSRICFADGVREIVLAALSDAPGSPEQTIVGVGRLNVAENGGQAELAVLVADEYQGRGLGKELVGRLIQLARERKLTRLNAEMLRDNITMQAVLKRFGFRLRLLKDLRSVGAVLDL